MAKKQTQVFETQAVVSINDEVAYSDMAAHSRIIGQWVEDTPRKVVKPTKEKWGKRIGSQENPVHYNAVGAIVDGSASGSVVSLNGLNKEGLASLEDRYAFTLETDEAVQAALENSSIDVTFDGEEASITYKAKVAVEEAEGDGEENDSDPVTELEDAAE